MEEMRKKYKAERKSNRSADYSAPAKPKKSDLIERLTKKYKEEL